MAPAALSKQQRTQLLSTLQERFEKNAKRHAKLAWSEVAAKLEKNNAALHSLFAMEESGGEPDVIGHDEKTGEIIFCDCSAESPEGRRNICYDREGYEKRLKEGLQPIGCVLDMAADMGIEPLDEEQYFALHKLGEFDLKSQSWIKAPAEFVKLGGGLFGDRRFGRVFVYHNTPPSFYRARGFRGLLRV